MAILKKVNGVYQDIGGLSKKISGVVSDADSAWVKENGVWVEKWANFNPNLPSMTFAERTFNLDESDNDFDADFGTQIPKSKLVEALSKGYTKLSFFVHAQCNKYYQGDFKINLARPGYITYFSEHAIVGCRGDDTGIRLTDEKTVVYNLADVVDYMNRYPSANQYLVGHANITQNAGYSVRSFTVSGYINNIHFTN